MTYNGYWFREFYTGWLTHWGEKIANTDAENTALFLRKILSRNGSVVLYVCNLHSFLYYLRFVCMKMFQPC